MYLFTTVRFGMFMFDIHGIVLNPFLYLTEITDLLLIWKTLIVGMVAMLFDHHDCSSYPK